VIEGDGMRALFANRSDAGRRLAALLQEMGLEDPVVLALPRGGVAVAAEIAKALAAPLDLVLVRKIGVPWQPELAAAAVVDGEFPEIVFNREVMDAGGLSEAQIRAAVEAELKEIERRRSVYLRGAPPTPLESRTAIVVDDGIATGTTVRAALVALRRRRPKRLVLAVPLAPTDTLAELRPLVDDITCLATPAPFIAIGPYYWEFHQLSDAEVIGLLAGLRTESGSAESAPS
jgi:putative phosphoribosyl transferase